MRAWDVPVLSREGSPPLDEITFVSCARRGCACVPPAKPHHGIL